MPYTPLAPRRWNSSKFLRWRRGALFRIIFLPKLAILGAPNEGWSTIAWRIASLRRLFTAPAAPYFHLRRGLLFSCTRDARLAPNERRGDPIHQWLLPLPPRRRPMDRGFLAQQSDVRCKRGRLSVIMITPAAHTFKGLAKAFVSSAGGTGPENRDTLAPLLFCSEA